MCVQNLISTATGLNEAENLDKQNWTDDSYTTSNVDFQRKYEDGHTGARV